YRAELRSRRGIALASEWQLGCRFERGGSHMHMKTRVLGLFLLALVGLSFPPVCPARVRAGAPESNAEITHSAPPVLWRSPTAIASRDLFYGPGGKEHEP